MARKSPKERASERLKDEYEGVDRATGNLAAAFGTGLLTPPGPQTVPSMVGAVATGARRANALKKLAISEKQIGETIPKIDAAREQVVSKRKKRGK